MIPSDRYMHKDLVVVTIEKALFSIGMPVYEAVVSTLQEKYNAKISDCYEHPQYLKNALEQYFGTASNVVVDSINKDLKNATKNEIIEKFLLVLNS